MQLYELQKHDILARYGSKGRHNFLLSPSLNPPIRFLHTEEHALCHDLLFRWYLYHCVCSWRTCHNSLQTPVCKHESAVGDVHSNRNALSWPNCDSPNTTTAALWIRWWENVDVVSPT